MQPRQAGKLAYTYAQRNALLPSRYPLMHELRSKSASILSVSDFRQKFKTLKHTQKPTPHPNIQVFGRVEAVRQASSGLFFIDLLNLEHKVQVVANKKAAEMSETDFHVHNLLRPGDAVAVVGVPWRTKAGELSLFALEPVKLASPCLLPLPVSQTASTLVRRHNRVAELKAFRGAREALRARSLIQHRIAEFLLAREFVQVATPVLSPQRGGAAAKPFVLHTDNDGPLPALRVAPELWLKRLVVGGMDRVFEIGPCFRNEGLDATHNPEFTSCEFYAAYMDLDGLISLTKELVTDVLGHFGSVFPQYNSNVSCVLQDWQVLDYFSTIEAQAGPLPSELSTENLEAYMAQRDIPIGGSAAKLLDRLAAKYIEPKCDKPTFIVNHPSVMAPLAKQHEVERNGQLRQVSKRFELFIHGREYVNAYEEENDPEAQLAKFKAQARDNDLDATMDMAFVEALRWGLPPTAGWGLGLDRLVMLACGLNNIEQALSFRGATSLGGQ